MTVKRRPWPVGALNLALAFLLALFLLLLTGPARAQTPVLPQFLAEVPAGDLVAGADAFGPMRDDIPVAPVMQGNQQLGWAFITSDFVGTTGYSGKPIHTMVAVDDAAKVIGVKLVKHSEPIVLIGIPNSRMEEMAAGYVGLDLVAEAAAGGSAHDLNIIAGATVTVMVIDDNIVRAGLRVARALGLGGLGSSTAENTPPRELAADVAPVADWAEAEGDGTVRRLLLTVGEVNEAYNAHDDLRAAARPLPNDPETVFIDMQAALVSVPAIGQAILGPAEYANVTSWLEEGDSAIAIVGLGIYSFKGSGYVRGGIFDRIQLIQDDISVRFRDRQHRRTTIALAGAPAFTEMDLFRIPADSGFDPAKPFRIQLLVHRDVSALEKAFLTYDLGYQLPERYLTPLPPPEPVSALTPATVAVADTDEAGAQAALWKRAWDAKRPQIAILAIMLGVLTAAFFFQEYLSRSERAVRLFRLGFLTVTLVVLGWMWNAQLSVVNIFALFNSLRDGFSWQAFLMDPLTFILWFSVAAALIFWGRGAYCGWLCPFGALQELTNQIGRKLRIPQITVPWFIHERAWAIKYVIFLGLFGVSLMSLERAEHLAEVEPFKTAIILNFQRSWPFLLYVGALLVAGLFIERFFCRYLCPLGAALAIPARIRMFDWLKRYKECGNPCQTCANECFVQAIHPEGQINPNECLNCMHCQVLYHSETKCPVVIKRLKRRANIAASNAPVLPRAGLSNHPNLQTKGV
ncbi:MAG: 4Fe-4S binding protein [Paracoccus sp. (in: a-proteobacteria)]|uniref:NosR/NirI family protein n=1 Tax=Paracoccus sp. TaxID=267 RepID=UPI0026DFA5A5|nr:NosR/NirI family protein [Paracoccus sp. (in: a-proteobacteria)]MDO5630314.1 4Fe-4S binding protein [Paracoccus sp. (in: a-proteobacteria)]